MDEHTRAAVRSTRRDPNVAPLNIFATLARHPKLYRAWWQFGSAVFDDDISVLPPREREILILRTGWNCQAKYEWAQHAVIGRRAGLTDEELLRLTAAEGASAPGWDQFEAALVRAADELHHDSCVSDATWAELSGRYTEAQLIEAVLVVGQYHLVSMALNSFGVELDPGLEGFPPGAK